jgi:hypothetical protein
MLAIASDESGERLKQWEEEEEEEEWVKEEQDG